MADKWVTERWAKSGELVKWLGELCPGGIEEVRLAVRYNDRWSRRWIEWRNDPYVRIDVAETLDGFLCFIGIPLALAPDSVFGDPGVRRYRKGSRTTPRDRRAEAVKYAQKHTPKKAADKYGVTVGTVRYWIRADKKARGESTARTVDPMVDKAARMRLDNPHLSYREIERRTGVARTTIRRRVDKLVEAK